MRMFKVYMADSHDELIDWFRGEADANCLVFDAVSQDELPTFWNLAEDFGKYVMVAMRDEDEEEK